MKNKYIILTLLIIFFVMITSCTQSIPGKIPPPGMFDQLTAYKCTATDGTDFFVFVNARSTTAIFTLSESVATAECVADQDQAGATVITDPKGYSVSSDGLKVTIDPVTSVILRM